MHAPSDGQCQAEGLPFIFALGGLSQTCDRVLKLSPQEGTGPQSEGQEEPNLSVLLVAFQVEEVFPLQPGVWHPGYGLNDLHVDTQQ